MMRSARSGVLVLVLATAAPAQVHPAQIEQVPTDLVLETIRAAYDKKPTADEIKVTLYKGSRLPRLPSDSLASDTFIVRIDPGPGAAATPARLFLDFGSLRALVADNQFTAISPAVPSLYFQTKLPGPLTPHALAAVLPPTPIPELALACSDPAVFGELTPYTPKIAWTSATVDTTTRVVTLSGASAAGPIVIAANSTTGRLTHLTATVRGQPGENTLELAITSADVGNPASWAVPTQGRVQAKSLAELRSAAPSTQLIVVGQAVPDLAAQRADFSPWSLHRALAEPPAIPFALVLYRATPERLEAASRDARAGAAAVRAAQFGQATGEQRAAPIDLKLAAAVVMELGQFSRDAFNQEQRAWLPASPAPVGDTPAAPPTELLWLNSVAQSIDRFDAKAGAALLLISPDKKLLAVIPLDGRAADLASLTAELRAKLAPAPPTP